MKSRILLPLILIVGSAGYLFFWMTDTHELPHTPDNFTGAWHLIREEGWEKMYGRKSSWVIEYSPVEKDTYYEEWGFGTDSVCVKTKNYGEKTLQTDYYSYECADDTIVLCEQARWHDRTTYRIEQLTESQLVLTQTTDGIGRGSWTLVFERLF